MRFQQTHNQGLHQLFLRCPWTSAPRTAHLTVSLYLCSFGSNARGESRALEGHSVSSKSPSKVLGRDKGVAGRNKREKHFPEERSLICPPGKSMIFFQKRKQKFFRLVARPSQPSPLMPASRIRAALSRFWASSPHNRIYWKKTLLNLMKFWSREMH